jgi:transposase
MGASNYTFAEATASQKSHDWISSHVRLGEFLGGVAAVFVPDQLKSGVVIASRYEPAIQRTYQEWSQHYSTTILPARPGRRVTRRRSRPACSSPNAGSWRGCETSPASRSACDATLSQEPARALRRTRRPSARCVAGEPFNPGDWSYAIVGHDYHVRVERDGHDYSVPYTQIGNEVEIRVSAATVEIFTPGNGERIAAHTRSFARGGTTTVAEHMPASHRKYREESISDYLAWAEIVGACMHTLVRTILDERPHSEHGLRSCRGLKHLTKQYAPERVEAASGARSHLNVESIHARPCDWTRWPQPGPNNTANPT